MVERDALCMSTMQAVERNVICMSTLLAVDVYTLQVHAAGRGKGGTPLPSQWRWWKGIYHYIKTAGGGEGYALHVHTSGDGQKDS